MWEVFYFREATGAERRVRRYGGTALVVAYGATVLTVAASGDVYHRDSGRDVPWHIRADETSDCRDARLVRPSSEKSDNSDLSDASEQR